MKQVEVQLAVAHEPKSGAGESGLLFMSLLESSRQVRIAIPGMGQMYVMASLDDLHAAVETFLTAARAGQEDR